MALAQRSVGPVFPPGRWACPPADMDQTMVKSERVECLAGLLAPHSARVGDDLAAWLVEPGTPESLAEAMRYCVLDGGKRLRPSLVFLSAAAAGGDATDELTRRSAVAVELVHCYSLVHDDLPGMDDDTLRRGRPTAHVRFGEAMAILVGDALLTRAVGILAEADAPAVPRLLRELSAGAGPAGMIAGQVADMGLCDVPDGLEGLRYVHLRKTAALIRAAARMGAICAGADGRTLGALTAYAESLGLAFQLVDDLLDVTGSADRLGKTPGKDAEAGKPTHAGQVGLDRARQLGQRLTRDAIDALAPLGAPAEPLRKLAELLIERTH